MDNKQREYLAVQILNEGNVVNYRTLSRAFKVHVNLAKQVLYEFHRQQNAKKSGSVHATYIITGQKRTEPEPQVNGAHKEDKEDGEDGVMPSSPFVSSMPERDSVEESQVRVSSVSICREEDLDEIKKQFDEITSIHIYSLERATLKDLQVLSDCNLQVTENHRNEDPLVVWKNYGIIQNPNVKRRKRGEVPSSVKAGSTSAQKAATKLGGGNDSKTAISSSSKTVKPESHEDAASARPVSQGSTHSGSSKPTSKAPTLKREKSDLFKSFAKAKTKTSTASASAPADLSPGPDSAEPSGLEDEPMDDASEDEQDDEPVLVQSKPDQDQNRKTRAEREEALRRMMEDEDEPMEDAPGAEMKDDDEPAVEAERDPLKEPTESGVAVSGGRRRGKRRVMKKKTMKDEEGYLVTKEEPVWESFSEDEPEAKEVKATAAHTSSAKAKKGPAKQGQGNIMTFFSKR